MDILVRKFYFVLGLNNLILMWVKKNSNLKPPLRYVGQFPVHLTTSKEVGWVNRYLITQSKERFIIFFSTLYDRVYG